MSHLFLQEKKSDSFHFWVAFCNGPFQRERGRVEWTKQLLRPSLPASTFLDPTAPPSELLEICELSQEKMSSVFEDSNVYMLHMMYQAMGVCLYTQDWEGALRYGQKIIKPYR